MLEPKKNSFPEVSIDFDFKAFFRKILKNWKWLALTLIITFSIAYNKNVRQQKMYAARTTFLVKKENNPFFSSSNTSLVFNWGSGNGGLLTLVSKLTSRTHNEIVVDKLQYYIEYLEKGEYRYEDVYGKTPFTININKNKAQLFGTLIKIHFVSNTEYDIEIDFIENKGRRVVYYSDKTTSSFTYPEEIFKQRYKVNEPVKLPFLNFVLQPTVDAVNYKGKEYYIRFVNFTSVVNSFRSISTRVREGSSIIQLELIGPNKTKLVKYLNTTVTILKNKELRDKNIYAINTINFIDSTLLKMETELKGVEKELNDLKNTDNTFALEDEAGTLREKLTKYDIRKDAVIRKIDYLNHLQSYLNRSNDYSKLPAPSVVGIEDPNILSNVQLLIESSKERDIMSYSIKDKKIFSEFDRKMQSTKNILLQNITANKQALNVDLTDINKKLSSAENELRKFPQLKQDYIKITRRYKLKDNIYATFMKKRAEAEIMKASNTSDIEFIDKAKDGGGGLQTSKTATINYILAFLFGLILPLLGIFIITFLDTKIYNVEDIKRVTDIPIIGVVGVKNTDNNLSVFQKPKSPLAESFRAIRSSLQYLYKKQNKEETLARTVMLTSSVSGEGKTFCTINLATVFALSKKKTIIVGLDLRKPRIFDDFNVDNSVGVVNHLIGAKTLDEITQKTHIPYLDLITSGPIPPNPSELLMSEEMKEMIAKLKKKYDYIILDTPPVGLVSDALELSHFADATLYVSKQSYSKKDMLNIINEKYRRGELHNVSILLNGFDGRKNYGYGVGGYGYSYSAYGETYHDEIDTQSKWKKIVNKWRKKLKL